MRILVYLACFALLWGCSGDSSMEVDKKPPVKPVMVAHMGDSHLEMTSDGVIIDEINYYEGEVEKNGTDAVSGGDWIQIQWARLSDLPDIDYMKVFRFSLEDYENDLDDYLVTVDSFSTPQVNYYVDTTDPEVGLTWFYFIEVFDAAGNSTKSDTVAYRLIEKAFPVYPTTTFSSLDDLEFTWELGSSSLQSSVIVTVFDGDYNLLWQYVPLDGPEEGFSVEYDGLDYNGDVIIWRVDASQTAYTYLLEDKFYTIYSGSESNEKVLYRQ